MNNIQCLDCEHFRMWDGDPCCLEPNDGWKLVLPDLKKDCNNFKLRNREDKEENDIWKRIWELEKKEFFKTYNISERLYKEYTEQHPEYKEFITKYGEENN